MERWRRVFPLFWMKERRMEKIKKGVHTLCVSKLVFILAQLGHQQLLPSHGLSDRGAAQERKLKITGVLRS
jgi:hypothetical protein